MTRVVYCLQKISFVVINDNKKIFQQSKTFKKSIIYTLNSQVFQCKMLAKNTLFT